MKRGGKGPAPDPMQEFDAARAMLAEGATRVADRLLDAGVNKIDALFGEGFARAHPDLLGRYLDAAARIFEGDMASVGGMEDDDVFDDLLDDLDRRRR